MGPISMMTNRHHHQALRAGLRPPTCGRHPCRQMATKAARRQQGGGKAAGEEEGQVEPRSWLGSTANGQGGDGHSRGSSWPSSVPSVRPGEGLPSGHLPAAGAASADDQLDPAGRLDWRAPDGSRGRSGRRQLAGGEASQPDRGERCRPAGSYRPNNRLIRPDPTSISIRPAASNTRRAGTLGSTA